MKSLKMWLCHTLGWHHIIILQVDDWCSWGNHWIEDDPRGHRSY